MIETLFACMGAPLSFGEAFNVMLFIVGLLVGALIALGICAAWSER